jgi:hypothetical protein
VTVLRLNVRLDKMNSERSKLRADNAAIASELSSAAASPRVQALARRQGLIQADPAATTFLRLSPRGR